jgi:hypothetical protein
MSVDFAIKVKNFALTKGFLFALALIFSATYIVAAQMHPQSHIHYDPKLEMEIVYWRARLLFPFLLQAFLPSTWIDTAPLRFAVALIFSTGLFITIQAFFRRMGQKDHIVQAAPLFLFVVLMLHYVVSLVLNVYYVYDIPAIFFYVGCFLLLTDQRRYVFFIGIAAVLLFTLNRETIMVAAFHAAGHTYFVNRGEKCKKEMWLRLGALGAAIAGTFVIKMIVLHCLGAVPSDSASLYERGTFRLWANIKRILHEPSSTMQMVILGCGVLFWLPILYKKTTKLERFVLLSSLPTLPAFLLAGNLTELRGYNEFVPLIALLLARYTLDVWGREASPSVERTT